MGNKNCRIFLYKLIKEEKNYMRSERWYKENSMIKHVHKMVPDILHVQNRTSNKLFSLLQDELFKTCGGNAHRVSEKCKEIEKVINETALGTSECPANNKIECFAGKITPFKESNHNTNKIFIYFVEIIDIVFSDVDVVNDLEWNSRYTKYVDVFRMFIDYFCGLWKKENKTKEQCDALQELGDRMMTTYVELWGVNNITNYFHYIECGHIDYFLRNCEGNIMIYANQGWEAMNGRFKFQLQRKTQRGGHAGVKGKKEPLHISALRFTGRWLLNWLYPDANELKTMLFPVSTNDII